MSTNTKKSILADVDTALAPLNYAVELQKVASRVGFDWPNILGVVEKIHEELEEVLAETEMPDNQQRLHDEIGDLLFAITNLARHLDIDPNQAIDHANAKFFRRFKQLEDVLAIEDKGFADCTLDQLDAIWHKVKHQEPTNE